VLAFLSSLLILLIRAASLNVVTPFLATTQMLAAEFLYFGICEGAKNRPAILHETKDKSCSFQASIINIDHA
jgi:hypothetical protein